MANDSIPYPPRLPSSPIMETAGKLGAAASKAIQDLVTETFNNNEGYGGFIGRYETTKDGVLWEGALGKV